MMDTSTPGGVTEASWSRPYGRILKPNSLTMPRPSKAGSISATFMKLSCACRNAPGCALRRRASVLALRVRALRALAPGQQRHDLIDRRFRLRGEVGVGVIGDR